MTIAFTCRCGQSYRLDDECAGRRVKCKVCATVTSIPLPSPARLVPQSSDWFDDLATVRPGAHWRDCWKCGFARVPEDKDYCPRCGEYAQGDARRERVSQPPQSRNPGWHAVHRSAALAEGLALVALALACFVLPVYINAELMLASNSAIDRPTAYIAWVAFTVFVFGLALAFPESNGCLMICVTGAIPLIAARIFWTCLDRSRARFRQVASR